YGLAENTLLAAGAEAGQAPTILPVDRTSLAEGRVVVRHGLGDSQHTQELVGCGSPATGHRLEIIHPETGHLCPEGTVGEIVIQGPSVARGYWRGDVETNRNFHTYVEGLEGQFLRTGDLGFLFD